MVLSPDMQTQAPRQDSYCRLKERYPLVRKGLQYIDGCPIVFRSRVDKAGSVHRFVEPA
jgi:hypothetical protein